MATHDYVIDNQTAPNFRADLNNALAAIVTQNSNATAPSVTYANMFWYDTANNLLRKRNEANSGWITLGTIDEGTGTFTPSGERALATEAEAKAGTSNTTLMTPLRTNQVVDQYLILRSVAVDTSSGGAYVARTLGTTVKNTITGASVSSPTFTLPEGKYLFRAFAMGYSTSFHHIILQNTTDSTTTLVGSQSFSRNDSDAHPTPTAIDSYFEIAGTKNFQVQHYAGLGGAGLASIGSDGTTLQTLSVIVQKVG
jgi:hypothetical protein